MIWVAWWYSGFVLMALTDGAATWVNRSRFRWWPGWVVWAAWPLTAPLVVRSIIVHGEEMRRKQDAMRGEATDA